MVRMCRECTGWREQNESQVIKVSTHGKFKSKVFDLLQFTRETLATANWIVIILSVLTHHHL